MVGISAQAHRATPDIFVTDKHTNTHSIYIYEDVSSFLYPYLLSSSGKIEDQIMFKFKANTQHKVEILFGKKI